MSIYNETIYNYIIYIWFILYILSVFGLYNKAPEYLLDLDFYLKLYIGIFLVLRFNPFVKSKLEDFDKKIIFASGTFILFTTLITNFFIPKGERVNILKQTSAIKNIVKKNK